MPLHIFRENSPFITADLAARLLFSLARRVPDEASARESVAHGPDFHRFERFVIGHAVAGPVHAALKAMPDLMPAATSGRIARAAHRSTLHAMALAAEMMRIVRALEQENVPVLVLKGAVEGVLAWGDPVLRGAGDVDLFVPPAAARRAAEILIAHGFRPVSSDLLPIAGVRWLQPSEIRFRSERGGHLVELHWAFAAPVALFPLSVEAACARRVRVAVGGISVPTLPDPERFLYLCVHGSGHGWTRLNWLADIAENLRRWDRIGEQAGDVARSMGLTRPFAIACHLAAALLGAPLPEGCPPLDSTGQRLAGMWGATLAGLPDADTRRGWRPAETRLSTDLSLCTGGWAKGKVLAGRLLLPRPEDVIEAPTARPWELSVRRLIRLGRNGPRRVSRKGEGKGEG